jgi:hypothetical protein
MRSWLLGMVTLCLALPAFSQHKILQPQKGYSSWLPAPSPDQAMLLGNGEMGAMVFGNPHEETIIMNHAALYLPLSEPKKPINQAERLDEIRQLIVEGKGAEAAKIPVEISLNEDYGGQIWSDPFIPAFDVKLSMSPGNIEHYKRSVDFESGEAIVTWTQDGYRFERKQFISRADSVMVIEVKSETTFNASVSFDRRPIAWNQWDYINRNFKNTRISAQNDKLFYHSEFVNQSDGSLAGFDGVGKICHYTGELKSNNNHLELTGTDRFLLIIKIKPYLTGETDYSASTSSHLDQLVPDYVRLLEAHRNIHSAMFNRVEFGLGDPGNVLPIDSEVMNLQSRTQVSQQAIVNRFYAARYNILSATGINPPNLQGIWGSSFQPPWSSDYTHDGNLPVAISSFLCGNMPELMMSFFDYHDARVEDYRENARKLYGCRGIQVPSHSSSRGYNVHFDPTWCLTFWNGGAAWTASFYYDYWLYTHDTAFLKNRAYPFMKEAALFMEDFVSEGKNGKLNFNPSYSPENNPLNHPSQATINATMDVMLTSELLRNLISAGQIANEESNQLKTWEKMLKKLPEYEVDSSGALREWLWPGYAENHNHRHVSQLYGMFDRIDPQMAANPKLIEGVRKVVAEKLRQRQKENGGIMVFGLVQLAWLAANLGDADRVEEIIKMLNSRYWSDSQATYHDPDGLFNMDLSGGYQSVVIRSLVHSDNGIITIFPAKPPSWEKGYIKGVAARNRVMISELTWDQGHLLINMESPVQQKVSIDFPAGYGMPETDKPEGTIAVTEKTNSLLVNFKPNETVRIRLKKINQHE